MVGVAALWMRLERLLALRLRLQHCSRESDGVACEVVRSRDARSWMQSACTAKMRAPTLLLASLLALGGQTHAGLCFIAFFAASVSQPLARFLFVRARARAWKGPGFMRETASN